MASWFQLREGQGGGEEAGRRREDTESTESSRHEDEQKSREREEGGTRRRSRDRTLEVHVVFRRGFQAAGFCSPRLDSQVEQDD